MYYNYAMIYWEGSFMKKIIVSVLAMLLIAAMLMGTAMAASTVTVTGGRVNVRTGPGKEFVVRGVVSKGTALTYKDEKFTDERGVVWYKVLYQNVDSWISSTYSSLNGASSGSGSGSGSSSGSTGSGTISASKIYAVSGKTYIRNMPNLNGKIITTLQKGASAVCEGTYEVDSRGVTWYKVSLNGKSGWVSSKYTSTTPAAAPAPAPSTSKKVTATAGSTKVRTAPNLDGAVLGYISKGKSVAYLENTSTDARGVVWYQVSYKGNTGWVSSRYTTIG